MLEEYPNGYDWTGISNATLIHSPDEVIYVSIDNPNHIKLARDILPREAWPSPAYHAPKTRRRRHSNTHGPRPPRLAAPPLLPSSGGEDIAWPQFVGPEAMSALFTIMDRRGALQVWASIAEAEYRARRTFNARAGQTPS